MYELVQQVHANKKLGEETGAPNAGYSELMKKDKLDQDAKKGWRNADDDFHIPCHKAFDNNTLRNKQTTSIMSPSFDQKATIKR